MEDIDIRVIINKLLSRWLLFAAALAGALLLAFLYLKCTEENFLVKASIQLKDQGLSEKGSASEKFINGLELLESNAQLEDEIAILSSFSTISQAVKQTGAYNSLYAYHPSLGPFDRSFARETYRDVVIRPDLARPQLVEVPVHITFTDRDHFTVAVEADRGDLYHYLVHTTLGNREKVHIAQKGTVGKRFVSPYLSFTLEPAEGAGAYWEKAYYFVNHTLKSVAESYQGKLKVVPVADNSNIVNIILLGAVPDKEIEFLNTLASVYIENDLQKRNKLGYKTIDFIDSQLGRVADTLQDVEGLMENFRAKSNVVDIQLTSQMLTTLLNELEEKQIERKSQHQYYQHIAGILRKNNTLTEAVTPSSVGINDPSLNKLLEDLTGLNRERVTILYNSSGDKNPVLRTIDQKIARTTKALNDNIESLTERSAIAIRENQRRIDEVKGELSRLPRNERSLNTIQRKFELNDNIYKYLLEKRAEAGIVLASNAPDKSLIDPARQVGNKPVSPNRMAVLLVALMAGLFLPAGLILVGDYFTGAVETEDQVEKLVNLPVVASVSYDGKRKKHGPVTANPHNENAFRTLCHYLKFRNIRTIGVTSMVASEGKTYCAANLAVALARSGHKTLLIDTDVYKADLTALFFMAFDPGTSDAEPARLRAYETPVQHLDIITLVKWSPDPGCDSPVERLGGYLPDLKKRYDYIVLDTSPVGIVPDYLSLARQMDHTVVVVRKNVTGAGSLHKLNKILTANELTANTVLLYNGIRNAKQYNAYYQKIAV